MRIIYYKVTTGKRQYPAPRIGITIYKNKLSLLKGSTVMNCLKFGGLFLKSVLDKGYSSGRSRFAALEAVPDRGRRATKWRKGLYSHTESIS